MITRTIVLNFPKNLTKEPVTYRLVKDYDLMFNILKAKIKQDEQGMLVIQLKGKEKNMELGMEYLTSIGIIWENLSQGIKWDDRKCIHCSACTSVCPSKALDVDRKTMYVNFDNEKCIACELCLSACSFKAITLDI